MEKWSSIEIIESSIHKEVSQLNELIWQRLPWVIYAHRSYGRIYLKWMEKGKGYRRLSDYRKFKSTALTFENHALANEVQNRIDTLNAQIRLTIKTSAINKNPR